MKRSLAQNAAFNVVYRLLNVIFPLISATYVARILSADGVGKVAYAHNIVSYFLMVAALGIPQYGTRAVAQSRGDAEKRNKLFTELLVINSISTMLCIGVYYILIGAAFSSELLLYAVCGMELVFNFINIDWFYQGEEEYTYITVRSAAIKVLSLLAMFRFVRTPQDYPVYALIQCMGVGGNYLFNVFHARKSVRLTFHGLNIHRHLRPIMILMVSSVVASLYNKVDITMLGWMSTDAAVGYYTNAHKVISIVLTLVTAISAVFFPRLSYVFANDKGRFVEYISNGLRLVLFLALPCCAGIIVVADDLVISLFGNAFAAAAPTLRTLAVFTIIKGAGDLLCYQVIISSGNEAMLIKSRIVAGLLNIILNALLIPRYSHNGAAVASVISELTVNGMLLGPSLSIARPVIGRRFLASTVISTLGMTVAAAVIQSRMRGGMAALAVTVIAGVFVYGSLSVITKNELTLELFAVVEKKLRRHNKYR